MAEFPQTSKKFHEVLSRFGIFADSLLTSNLRCCREARVLRHQRNCTIRANGAQAENCVLRCFDVWIISLVSSSSEWALNRKSFSGNLILDECDLSKLCATSGCFENVHIVDRNANIWDTENLVTFQAGRGLSPKTSSVTLYCVTTEPASSQGSSRKRLQAKKPRFRLP